MLRDCLVVGVEGTHASGKTTLAHALVAYYRERGVHVACVPEPARNSPFIEEIVVHGRGEFDVETEVDLFAAHLSNQLRTARRHTMIVADKTIANVLAYAWLVLPGGPDGPHGPVLRAMEAFCRAWSPAYDVVFYCCDRFEQQQIGDPYRAKVLDIQPAADRVVRSVCASVGQRVIDIPPNMSTGQRVAWIAERLTSLGLDPTSR
ncbi:MAG: AAA family ATPase [Micromonosporaceae bacterium]|nr:AAA family ATPase [Micromonosporaceae bacterium]